MSAAAVWTSREVHFACAGRTSSETFEAFMDALVTLYWETWWLDVALRTPSISSHGLTVEVGGIPRWVPGWLSRNSVARVAASLNITGDAEFRTLRATLATTTEETS